jgi:hypothetical protein
MAPSIPGSSKFGAGDPIARMGCVCCGHAASEIVRITPSLDNLPHVLFTICPLFQHSLFALRDRRRRNRQSYSVNYSQIALEADRDRFVGFGIDRDRKWGYACFHSA